MTTLPDTKTLLQTHQYRKSEFGRLLAEIDHEWKQPLNTISLLSSGLITLYNDGRLNEEVLNDLQQRLTVQINSLNDIIAHYRTFYGSSDQKGTFNLISTLNNSLVLINYLVVKQNLKIQVSGDSTLSLFGPVSDFQQVIISFIVHSSEIFSEKSITDRQISIKANKSENEKIIIDYRDNCGEISEQRLQDLCSPDHQKNELSSSGITLYLAKVIISEIFKGTLSIQNSSKGLNFTLEL